MAPKNSSSPALGPGRLVVPGLELEKSGLALLPVLHALGQLLLLAGDHETLREGRELRIEARELVARQVCGPVVPGGERRLR